MRLKCKKNKKNTIFVQVFGVCCTEPVQTPPQQEPDVQRLGILPSAVPLAAPHLQYAG